MVWLDGRGKCSVWVCTFILAKKLRSIVGHKECEEGSIVRQGPCEVGGWGGGGEINGKHYLTN